MDAGGVIGYYLGESNVCVKPWLRFETEYLTMSWFWQIVLVTCFSHTVNLVPERILGEFPNFINSLSVSPDGKYLAVVCERQGLWLFDLRHMKLKSRVKLPDHECLDVAFSPVNPLVAVSGKDISFYDLDGRSKGKIPLGRVGRLSFSGNGKDLFAGGWGYDRKNNDMIYMCDVQKKTVIRKLNRQEGGVSSMCYNAKRGLVASGASGSSGFDGADILGTGIKIWNLKRGMEIAQISGHTRRVSALQFTRDGSKLISGSWEDGTIKIWDVRTRKLVNTLVGHKGGIAGLAISPDDRLLASASDTIGIWDLATHNKVTEIKNATGGIYAVVFLPDSKRIAVVSRFKSIFRVSIFRLKR